MYKIKKKRNRNEKKTQKILCCGGIWKLEKIR